MVPNCCSLSSMLARDSDSMARAYSPSRHPLSSTNLKGVHIHSGVQGVPMSKAFAQARPGFASRGPGRPDRERSCAQCVSTT